jgi:DNA-directed RNA polymerase II subunit RPB11
MNRQLLSMPQVLFAGYKVPHPLHPHFLIKVQTDGSISPYDVVDQACSKLIGTIASLETKFKREFSFKDAETGGGGAVGTNDDPYNTGGGTWSNGKDYLDF